MLIVPDIHIGYPVQVSFVATEAEMLKFAAEVGTHLKIGDVVLLEGALGAGKTTFVRGYLESLGVTEAVRSPTFNLIQLFDTSPPVLHADLYRVASHEGIGIEEYLDTHVCLIEWPDRALGLLPLTSCWRVVITFEGEGRVVEVTPPSL